MTKTEYATYLASDRWRDLRKDFIEDSCHNPWGTAICENCYLPRWLSRYVYDQDLHVHHMSYEHLGTEEEYGDLMLLCRRCHEIETFGRTDLKAPKTARCSICERRHYNVYEDECELCSRLHLLGGANELVDLHFDGEGTGGMWGVSGEPKVATFGECVIARWIQNVGVGAAQKKVDQIFDHMQESHAHWINSNGYKTKCAPEFNCRLCLEDGIGF